MSCTTLKNSAELPSWSLTALCCLPSRNCTKVPPPQGSHFENATDILHYEIMSPSDRYAFFLDSAGFPRGVPHFSLSFTLCCLSDLSSLPVTWNVGTMHHARLGRFGFEVISSWVNCMNRYTDRSWWDNERDEERVHMLEDLVVVGWAYQAHQVASERNTCVEPSRITKIIEDPATLCHVQEKTKHNKTTSITS